MIAKDSKKLIAFYKKVFHCRSICQTRDLPGYGQDHPTLEIFSYDEMADCEGNIVELQSCFQD